MLVNKYAQILITVTDECNSSFLFSAVAGHLSTSMLRVHHKFELTWSNELRGNSSWPLCMASERRTGEGAGWASTGLQRRW